MKKVILLLAISVVLTSCGQTTKKENPDNSTVKQQVTKQNATIERLDAKSFYDRVNGKKVQLIDVRTPQEYAAGHLKNADNINVFDANFVDQVEKKYKNEEPVYVYCRSGGRSMKAAGMLKSKGFNVVNLNGGFNGWSAQGLPTE
jgi:rhodanese-related sulfurtransferase